MIYHFRDAQGRATASLIGNHLMDKAGNYWGISNQNGANGAGFLFELSPPATAGGAWTYQTIYDFPHRFIGTGYGGYERFFFDAKGNIVGLVAITGYGGPGCPNTVCGVIYQLTPPATPGAPWTETDLLGIIGDQYQYPGSMARGPGNKITGISYQGGTHQTGIVWQASPPKTAGGSWSYAVIHAFCPTRNAADGRCSDGYGPIGGLSIDSKGNIIGSTAWDGPNGTDGHGNAISSLGTVFKLTKPATAHGTWGYSLLHAFIQYPYANGHGVGDAQNPITALTIDKAGNLYGATYTGGPTPIDFDPASPAGVVYKLSPTASGPWTETILHIFPNTTTTQSDGAQPDSDLVLSPKGQLFGTTYLGGVPVVFSGTADGQGGEGVVYEVTP